MVPNVVKTAVRAKNAQYYVVLRVTWSYKIRKQFRNSGSRMLWTGVPDLLVSTVDSPDRGYRLIRTTKGRVT